MNLTSQEIRQTDVGLHFSSCSDISVGMLADVDEGVFFYYDAAFLELDINPAPFDIPFVNEAHEVEFEHRNPLGMLSDVLPDGWARRVLETQLAERGRNWASLRLTEKLALIGDNSVGALTFRPQQLLEGQIPSLTIEDLAATIIQLGGKDGAGIEVARQLVGSLGGVRPKANVWLIDGKISAVPQGEADPWIVKFPNPAYDDPNAGLVEYAYSLMAKDAGITMAPTMLVEHGDGPAYFATARFDRRGVDRYHYQSLAGLQGLSPLSRSSYLNLLGTDMQLAARDAPSEQLIRRMAFNVFASVRDDHTRNHGFLMNSDGIWAPAPAFDLTFDRKLEHEMAVGRNVRNPGVQDILDVVRELGGDTDRATTIIAEVRDIVAAWPKFAALADVDRGTVELIAASLAAIS